MFPTFCSMHHLSKCHAQIELKKIQKRDHQSFRQNHSRCFQTKTQNKGGFSILIIAHSHLTPNLNKKGYSPILVECQYIPCKPIQTLLHIKESLLMERHTELETSSTENGLVNIKSINPLYLFNMLDTTCTVL